MLTALFETGLFSYIFRQELVWFAPVILRKIMTLRLLVLAWPPLGKGLSDTAHLVLSLFSTDVFPWPVALVTALFCLLIGATCSRALSAGADPRP